MPARKFLASSLELIGNTPLIKLRNVASNTDAEIYVKAEYLNPSGSIKDRIALQMILDAESQGKIKRGKTTIVEASTGNTGIALSYVGTMLGYKVRIYIPEGVSRERKEIMEKYGAEVVIMTKQEEQSLKERSISGGLVEIPGRLKCLEVEKNEKDTFWIRQFSNPSNSIAHEKTGKEILDALDSIDGFTASIGTGGTLLGITRTLRKSNASLKVYAAEPAATRISLLSQFKQQGKIIRTEVSGGIISDIIEEEIVDKVLKINDQEAVEMAGRLVKEEGLFCGISSGANVYAAIQLAKELGKGSRIVTVLPDSMDRYLSEQHYTT
ncbi:MAG: cysteine synthase family protein [Conexivisphaerales archaeon]